MKFTHSLLLVLALSFYACSKDLNTDNAPGPELLSESDYIPGELLVQFRKGTDRATALKSLENRKGKLIEYVYTKAMEQAKEEGFYVVKMEGEIERSLNSLRSIPEVEQVEPNYIVHAPDMPQLRGSAITPVTATTEEISFPNDPYYPGQWHLRGPGSTPAETYGSNAEAVWQTGNTGSDAIHVAMIGTGIMYEHEDLADNMWTNINDPIDGIDNDGNGYIDDYRGWNFSGNNNQIYEPDFTLEVNGTMMASIIGAKGNNAKGVAGTCWNVKFITVKVYGGAIISVSSIVKGIDYITSLKNDGVNIVAANNHYEVKKSTQLESAMKRLNQADVLFVTSAGWKGNYDPGVDLSKKPVYPSCYVLPNIISVIGLKKDGTLASNANWSNTFVHLAAPGENLVTAIDLQHDNFGIKGDGYNDYKTLNTYRAVAHVTAAAVLYKASHANATGAEVKAAILNSAVETPSLSGKTITGKRLYLDPLVFGF